MHVSLGEWMLLRPGCRLRGVRLQHFSALVHAPPRRAPQACHRCSFFTDTAATEIYALARHDAPPI